MVTHILVADDSGACHDEFSKIFAQTDIAVDLTQSMSDCIEAVRETMPAAVVVYAGMTRAFSLLRLLRRSDDLAALPLVVVGEPDQEDLIAKHRQLPTRADRYLLLPLDHELVKSVMYDLIGDEGESETGPEDLDGPFEVADPDELVAEDSFPDGFAKLNRELEEYRHRVTELQQDLRLSAQVSKDVRQLQKENLELKEKLKHTEQNQTTQHNFGELFHRLEAGYKETIEDLERLIQDKDRAIAQLASRGEDASDQTRYLTEQLKEEHTRISELKRPISHALSVFAELEHLEAEMEFDEMAIDFAANESAEYETSAEFAFDEKTLVVNAEELNRKIREHDSKE